MKLKLVLGIALAMLAFAGIARAAGLFNSSHPRMALLMKEERLLRHTRHHHHAARISRVRRGPRGPRGPQGPAGPQGPQGPPGTFREILYVNGPTVTLCPRSGGECAVESGTATCPPGSVVIAGGEIGIGTPFISIPTNNRTWTISEANEFESSVEFHAVAVCAS